MNELIEKHIQSYARPNLKNFTDNNFEQIAQLSIGLEFNDEVHLANMWRVKFNQRLLMEREDVPLVKYLDKVDGTWTDIVKLSKSLGNLKRSYIIQSVEVLSAAAESVGAIGKAAFQDESSSQPPAANEEPTIDNTRDLAELKSEVRSALYKKLSSKSISPCLANLQASYDDVTLDTEDVLLKIAMNIIQCNFLTAEDIEIVKLCTSGILNLMCPKQVKHFTQYNDCQVIFQECKDVKENYKNNLNESVIVEIDNLFDEFTKFRFDEDLNGIIKKIQQLKNSHLQSENGSITSYYWQILSITEQAVFQTADWDNEDSEETFMRRFESLIDVVFRNTGIVVKDGEGVERSNQRMMQHNKDIFNINTTKSFTYGRKLDILIKCGLKNKRMDACSIEWKKNTASTNTAIHQQSKNLRVNGCILNDLRVVSSDDKVSTLTMDWVGYHGYMYYLKKIDCIYVASKFADVNLLSDLIDISDFRETVKNLFIWKQAMIDMNNTIKLSLIRQKRNIALVDLTHDQDSEERLSKHIKPVSIIFTPTNQTKAKSTTD